MPAPQGCSAPRIVGSTENPGARYWIMTRDREGYREYRIKHRVQVGTTQGPYTALYDTPGLPSPGSVWDIDDDFDEWAYCTQEATVTPVAMEGEPNEYFDIDQVFSTRPAVLCPNDEGSFEDPLLKADIISGNFVKYTEEAAENRFGLPIVNSAFEQLRGPQVEFDKNRLQVKIRQNVPDLEIDLLCELMDSVNTFPQWGFPARCVKFSGCNWSKHYHVDCSVYYTRELEFDIVYGVDADGNTITFDRYLLDEGTKVLPGHWDPVTGVYVRDLAAAVDYPCATTNGNPNVTVTGGSKIVVGLLVQGTGIPNGTTVTAIALPTVTLSSNATATGNVTLKFGTEANPLNPQHFVRFKDKANENTRVILNGAGYPYDPNGVTPYDDDDEPGYIHVEKYFEEDHTRLGIPENL